MLPICRSMSVILGLVLAPGASLAAPPDDSPDADAGKAVTELYLKKKLFGRNEYKALRRVFAKQFEQKHAQEIRRALGDDCDAMTTWLSAHDDIKEEFFTAMSAEHDNIEAVLTIFNDIRKQFPDKIVPYANLAIATALVWDNPRTGVYEYGNHQYWTRSTMPSGRAEALDSFRYIVENEPIMQGRGEFFPWEFSLFLVNARTPIDERQWAVENYLAKRTMIGKCYKDVPYDYDMLRGQTPRLAGKEYTLANIRRHGGVCAIQADFAGRVGKSLGVPAEYVVGAGNTGIPHAWVMWVEVKQVTARQLVFSLESFGRYNIDQYYTGQLRDPQTGQTISDRDLELRLTGVGADWQAKRHSELIMRAYPTIREELALGLPDQLRFLNNCITLCPYDERTWTEIAKLSRDGVLKRQHMPALMVCLNKLFTTFNRCPDFTWKVFDDLVSSQDDINQRVKLYERLIALYEAAERPDLACQARLKLADYQVEARKWKDAADGLAGTIRKFPTEGRYVPPLVDRLETVSKELRDGKDLLARFYLEFLPKIPSKRGELLSPYCVAMYERAVSFLRENGRVREADAIQNELTKIRANATKVP